jgi:hypothetical protein
MNKILLIIILLISKLSIGQSLKNLDEKNGINKFKLETDINLYYSDLTHIATVDRISFYSYNKVSEIKIFEKKLNEIWVYFYKNKLYGVNCYFSSKEKSTEDEIVNRLVGLFGKAYYTNTELEIIKYCNWQYSWSSNNVILQFQKNRCDSKLHPCLINLSMYSKKIKKQIEYDGL